MIVFVAIVDIGGGVTVIPPSAPELHLRCSHPWGQGGEHSRPDIPSTSPPTTSITAIYSIHRHLVRLTRSGEDGQDLGCFSAIVFGNVGDSLHGVGDMDTAVP